MFCRISIVVSACLGRFSLNELCYVLLCMQVLWSFLSGQGCIESSFMGKGVVSKASLIMAHLTFSTSHQPQCPKVSE